MIELGDSIVRIFLIKMRKTILFTVIYFFALQFSYAQTGKIRGKVIDGNTGRPAISATVKLSGNGTNLGMNSDLDGNFTFNVKAATYSLNISLIGFEDAIITNITVTSNNVTVVPDIILTPASNQLKEVVVASSRNQRTSEEAITTLKRKSVIMFDGISAAKMKLIGDGTAVEAAKRVTGVSIEGGKYVYVRGLGDRYSKSTMNGLDLPGLDPDRNSLQMDIFPTALIDNITVAKNFLPNMPADFAGGLLNIETNDFPTKKIFNVSASMGYNPSMHFKNNFLTGNTGSRDWLGMDDGSRALPSIARNSNNIPTPVSGASSTEVNNFVKSFNPTLGATATNSLADFSFGISIGDQIDLDRKGKSKKNPKFGYVAALSYRFDQRLYDRVQYGESQKNVDINQSQMVVANNIEGSLSEQNVLVGALLGLAYKTNFSKIKFNLIRLQSGESKAGKFDIFNNSDGVGQSGYIAQSDNIEYSERSVTNMQLSGSHVLNGKGWKIDWVIGNTLSTSDDPDIRKTAFTIDPGRTYFNAGAGGNPSRIWRYLDEVNLSYKVDLEKKIGSKHLLKFGALGLRKERNYDIKIFNVQFFGAQQQNWPLIANNVLLSQNIYPATINNIYYQSGNSNPNSNQYNSKVNSYAGYIMDEFNVTDNLKSIIGLRVEKYEQFHTGRDQRFASGNTVDGKNLDNAKVLDKFNLFPSLNLIQKIDQKTNLRFSYTKTTARPSFKELSFAQILDPLSNRIFNGSLFPYAEWDGNLVPTMIDNLDLRWEKYFKGAELISLSLFYKAFKNPIELVRIPQQQTSTEYQPRNVGNGNLFGVEFEFNKSLDIISDKLEKFVFSSNFTYVYSRVKISDVEFNARKAYQKAGEEVKNTREMAGQSPYLINTGLTYLDTDKGLNVGLFYNVKGPTLTIVGSGLFPDVFSVPYDNLSFSFNQALGKKKKMNLNLRIDNILNDQIEFVYKAYGAQDQVFSKMLPRQSFNLGFSYKL
ncbi:MAG: TonB-dependent receptor [Sphingobacteriia bacterium 28-36-52]|nr:MAG: TonB-dependent receptor [Sphingobacteriia bacterium 28-36-52]